MKNETKILLTGGHAGTVMLAVAEELLTLNSNANIHIIGPKYSYSNKSLLSLEQQYLKGRSMHYHELDSWKFSKKLLLRTILTSYKFLTGFASALKLVSKIKPDVTVSFGGYLSVPVVFASWLKGIPVLVHEQITDLGLANRVNVFFAKKVAVSRKDSLKYISPSKGILIGNPIRKSVLDVKIKTKLGSPPAIFVFTGSRASHVVNEALKEILEKLLKDFYVIHLTGVEDHKIFSDIKKSMPNSLLKNYEIYDFIQPAEVGKFYDRSDIVVSRSGANTVAEVMAVHRPAIFIPIPWSNYDEQTKNALSAQEFGIGYVLNEKDLTPEKLLSEIIRIRKDWNDIVNSTKEKESPDLHAAENFAKLILNESEIHQKRNS